MNTTIPEQVNLSKYMNCVTTAPHSRSPPARDVHRRCGRANHLSIPELAYQSLYPRTDLGGPLYYREHKAELDAQDAADAQQSLEMHQRYAKKPGRHDGFYFDDT